MYDVRLWKLRREGYDKKKLSTFRAGGGGVRGGFRGLI